MKQKPSRAGAKPASRHAAASQSQGQGWGFRWHAGHFRTALWWAVVAVGIVVTFGQTSGALAQWWLRDGYVATRATIVKAPFWADALDAQPDPNGAIAGWHIELRVGDYPFDLAVALADFDPDKNSTDQKVVPDAARFAPGTVHPVWFYADNKKKQPETVALLQSTPALVISRAAFGRFPTRDEAIENSIELLIAPGIMLSMAVLFLIAAFFGKRGGDTAGSTLPARLTYALAMCLVAAGAYLVNSEHPLAARDSEYAPAEIEITRAPFANDTLTHYSGYRVLWRTWRVEAKLTTPGAQVFTIDVDGLDPRRTTWASRHSPDFSALQTGMKLPVWQSNFHSQTLSNLGSTKQTIYWETFLSRERWPTKYTKEDFVKDNPVATAAMAVALALALVWLLPLGGTRVPGNEES